MDDGSSAHRDRYRLDELGWLQFERLASLVLEAEAGLRDLDWQDRAYRGRTAWVEARVVLAGAGFHLPGPVAVAVVWFHGSPHSSRLSEFVTRLLGVARDLGVGATDHMLVLTNLDEDAARRALDEQPLAAPEGVVVLGAAQLSKSLDRHPALRSAIPSVLGLR